MLTKREAGRKHGRVSAGKHLAFGLTQPTRHTLRLINQCSGGTYPTSRSSGAARRDYDDRVVPSK